MFETPQPLERATGGRSLPCGDHSAEIMALSLDTTPAMEGGHSHVH
ncbi:hypothetical protein BN2537_11587 [Streptomyces venezuelae]|nr:hypothetical protein BN2537_11587 [Streptomyces venezuelae]